MNRNAWWQAATLITLAATSRTASAQNTVQQAVEIQRWEALGSSSSSSVPANQLPADGAVSVLGDAELEGIRTKSELVAKYDDTEIYADAFPVGKLEVTARIPNRMDSFRSIPCTAWMISEKLALTAWHCIPGVASDLAKAGYQSTEQGQITFGWDRPNAMPDIYPIRRIIESDQTLDYAVVELATGSKELAPGKKYGVIKLLRSAPAAGTPLEIFHHPYGYYKLLLKDQTCKVFNPPAGGLSTQLYHQCDTRGGSSGAPILIYRKSADSAGRKYPLAVGLHTNGNKNGLANAATDFNFGTSTSAIVEHSTMLQRLACETEPGGIYCPNESTAIREFVVYFDWDKSDISPEASSILDQAIALLKNEPEAQILLSAHTDQSNSPTYAVGLSERMASSVRAYLEFNKIDAIRISSRAFGSSRPAVPLAPGTRELRNRRVDIEIH